MTRQGATYHCNRFVCFEITRANNKKTANHIARERKSWTDVAADAAAADDDCWSILFAVYVLACSVVLNQITFD